MSTSSGRPRAVSISTGTNCRACAQLGDHREAVLARQHHVEHDEIERLSRRSEQPLQRRLAGVDDFDAVALGLEVEAQPFGEMLLVLDDQDAVRGVVMLGGPAAAGA